MKRLLIILISLCLSAQVTLAQKTTSKTVEIKELLSPKITLPTVCKTINLEVTNQSGHQYKVPDFEFDKFQMQEGPSDLTVLLELNKPELISSITTHNGALQEGSASYTVSVVYKSNASYTLKYNFLGINLERDLGTREVRVEFDLPGEAIVRDNGNYYPKNDSYILEKINDNVVSNALNYALASEADFANEEITTYAGIYDVSSKKADYSSIGSATDNLQEGYDLVLSNNRKEGTKRLLEACEILSPLLAEADYDNNKAFINAKVAGALAGNLAYAYEIAGEIEKADEVLDLMISQKLKVPGGLYFNPIFIAGWKDRLVKRKVSMTGGPVEFEVPTFEVSKSENIEELFLHDLEGSTPNDFTTEFTSRLDLTYREDDLLDEKIIQRLYGPEGSAKVLDMYRLESMKGINFITSGNMNDYGYFFYKIKLDQEYFNGYLYVLRTTKEGQPVSEIAIYDGIIISHENYKMYDSQINNVAESLLIVSDVDVASYDCPEMKPFPNDFPVTHYYRAHVEYQLAIDQGQISYMKKFSKEKNAKFGIHGPSLRAMNENESKEEFLKNLEASSHLEEDSKNKIKKLIDQYASN